MFATLQMNNILQPINSAVTREMTALRQFRNTKCSLFEAANLDRREAEERDEKLKDSTD